MSYLEKKFLIHRDLASRNILVFSKTLVCYFRQNNRKTIQFIVFLFSKSKKKQNRSNYLTLAYHVSVVRKQIIIKHHGKILYVCPLLG